MNFGSRPPRVSPAYSPGTLPGFAGGAPRPSAPMDGAGASRFITLLTILYLFLNDFHAEILFGTDSETGYEPSPTVRAMKLGMLAGGALMAMRSTGLAMQVARSVNGAMWCFLGLAFASITWSIDSGATIGRCITVLSITAAAFMYVLSGWHPRSFQRVVLPAVMLLLLGSLAVGLYDHDLVIEHGEGTLKESWHGLSGQKNQFGQVGGFGAILWLNAWLSGERRSPLVILGFLISMVCVVLSRSSTSLLATVFSLMLMVPMLYAPPGLRRYLPYMAGSFAVIVVVYAIAVLKVVPGMEFLLEPVAQLTGKDLTFSNRSEIWDIVKENIADHPWLGSGYGGYWVGPFATSPSYQFLARMWFYPSESHNGYLEVVNDLGKPGLICLLAFLVVYVRQALALMRIDRPQGVLYLALFFFQAIVNLSQSCWFATNATFTLIVMTLSVVCVGRALLQARMSAGGAVVAAPPTVPRWR